MAKKKENWMPQYLPTQEENKAYIYCVKNNIRIFLNFINNMNL